MIDTLTDEQLASARARTHERINDLIVTPPRRSRKLPALALAVTAAAAAAVAFAPGGAPTRPAAASAATVLRGLKPQPLPALQPGEYYAVRVVQCNATSLACQLREKFSSECLVREAAANAM